MYAKIFAQIYDGTLCTNGPWEALVTFQQLLVLADEEGHVDMTTGAIARRTTIPLEIILKGIECLIQPDPESRTPTAEGRRIVPLSPDRAWGWLIVNYKHYRQIKREQDRRDYHRDYWHKRKGKDSTAATDSTSTQHAQPNQPIAEAEAEAVVKTHTPLAQNWKLPKIWGDWALAESPHWTAKTVRAEAAQFADHYRATAGESADWQATWQKWCRDDLTQRRHRKPADKAPHAGPPSNTVPSAAADKTAAELAEQAARFAAVQADPEQQARIAEIRQRAKSAVRAAA